MKDRSNHPGIYVLARLAPGVGLAQAREELAEIGRALEEEHPGSNAQVRPVAMPAGARLVRDARGAVLLLLGAVGLVVLVAVLNVAGLLLARGIARRKELAIRAALGAGRAALARQLLAEALVLAGGGGLLGLLLAAWGIEGAAAALRATGLTIPARPELNAGVVVAAVLAALAAGALAGLLPALALSEPRLHDALKETSLGATAGSGGRRARGALVVAEVALAFVLLSGAAMSARGLERLYAQDLGLEPRNVLTLGTASSPARQDGRARLRQRLQDVEDRIRAVPGVEAVSMADSVPFAGQSETTFLVRGAPRPPRGQEPSANVFFVGPEYPKALGIQVLAGRAFRPDDRGQQRVCLVDEALARAFFPGEEALGKWLESGDGQRAWEIVGVLGHVPSYGLAAEPLAPYQLYFPIDQISDKYFPLFTRDVVWAVRTSGPPLSAVAAIRDAVRQADPDQPVHGVRTLEDRMQGSVLRERLAAGLLAGFAAFALALAAVGLYGLVSHGVARRTRELGLRMALGAAPEAVVRMVLAQGMRLAGAGLAIGLAASLALARLMGRLVQGAGVVEPAVFAGLALLLAAVAALASFLPARRAVRIDPGVALREE
jgi:predicted permease